MKSAEGNDILGHELLGETLVITFLVWKRCVIQVKTPMKNKAPRKIIFTRRESCTFQNGSPQTAGFHINQWSTVERGVGSGAPSQAEPPCGRERNVCDSGAIRCKARPGSGPPRLLPLFLRTCPSQAPPVGPGCVGLGRPEATRVGLNQLVMV